MKNLLENFYDSFRVWNPQVAANLLREEIIDLGVARNARVLVRQVIEINAVPGAFAEELTAIFLQMAEQLAPFRL